MPALTMDGRVGAGKPHDNHHPHAMLQPIFSEAKRLEHVASRLSARERRTPMLDETAEHASHAGARNAQ